MNVLEQIAPLDVDSTFSIEGAAPPTSPAVSAIVLNDKISGTVTKALNKRKNLSSIPGILLFLGRNGTEEERRERPHFARAKAIMIYREFMCPDTMEWNTGNEGRNIRTGWATVLFNTLPTYSALISRAILTNFSVILTNSLT